MSDVLLVERRGGLAELTLNRPAARNALDVELKQALVDELDAVAADPAVRAVLLTGNGPAFCVGQDLAELARSLETDPASASDTVELHFNPITRLLATMPKPVVAAVHGTCVGAGLGFALACDVQVWGAGVTLATAFTGVALTCDSGLSASLARSVGEARARELVLLGDAFTPERGVAWGLAGRVVAPDEVVSTARSLAERLADGPTLALAASKELIAAGSSSSLDEVLAAEAAAQARCGASADHLAAVRAFLAKEPPVLLGR
ncbi:enoyl-CoA hydratase/isomerase family protein [Nocardioides sp. SYSU D00038]|uniref:enoyl-CoA hydratase/isomerase family protein n=1 Tax=Nocardioides sp. SYSU D00038 TaxID=2812554 RepID=UPI00196851CD|nr:enoyl-CoA hydratase-related protein [Nocardioides sp. SYSU D00038]